MEAIAHRRLRGESQHAIGSMDTLLVADECPSVTSVFHNSRKERPINGIGGSNDCPPAI